MISRKRLRMSWHALARVEERLSLTSGQVIECLEGDKAVPIGFEAGSSRSHHLFYSQVDRQCFVAIVDSNDGTVVSVLPPDYHNNCGWRVSEEAERMAAALSQDAPQCPPAAKPVAETPATVFKVMGRALGPNRNVWCVNLGSWPQEAYGRDVSRMVADPGFLAEARARLEAKRPQTTLLDLSIRSGGKVVAILPVEDSFRASKDIRQEEQDRKTEQEWLEWAKGGGNEDRA